jgi:hypothetical protein
MKIKSGALLIGTIVLAFVSVSLVADLLTPGGFNVGETIGGLYTNTQPSGTCGCEYDSQTNEYLCNQYCGSTVYAICNTTADCALV